MRVSIPEAAALLQTSEVVGVPTETVYGLAAQLNNITAIQKIFDLKKRPQDNPLIIHISAIEQIYPYTQVIPESFHTLASAFWPGSLTLVIPVNRQVPESVRAGLPTAAFRIPNHAKALELIDLTGPLVMPSANLSGTPSATRLEHVEHDFGANFPVIDGGVSLCGIESTILLYRDNAWQIGRLGAISAEELGLQLGYSPRLLSKNTSEAPLCPGQKYRHYAPNAAIFIGEEIPSRCEVIVGFEEREYPKQLPFLCLGSLSNPKSVANHLYDTLRKVDEHRFHRAWVDMNFPEEGLWKSIKERLLKSSTK